MKKRKLTRELIEKYSVKTHLEEQLKDPKFARGYEKGLRNLKLGYQIFCIREDAGMTQRELARRIGTRQANISRMEQGDYNFTVEMLSKIAQALHADLNIQITSLKSKKAA